MNTFSSAIRKSRMAMIEATKDLSLEELTFVPDGFNNNILWNLGHVISVHQLILYGLNKKPFRAPESIVMNYRKGTKPMEVENVKAEYESILEELISSLDKTEADEREGMFEDCTPFKSKILGEEFHGIEEIMPFIFFHEGMHFTTIKSYIRIIQSTKSKE